MLLLYDDRAPGGKGSFSGILRSFKKKKKEKKLPYISIQSTGPVSLQPLIGDASKVEALSSALNSPHENTGISETWVISGYSPIKTSQEPIGCAATSGKNTPPALVADLSTAAAPVKDMKPKTPTIATIATKAKAILLLFSAILSPPKNFLELTEAFLDFLFCDNDFAIQDIVD